MRAIRLVFTIIVSILFYIGLALFLGLGSGQVRFLFGG